MGSKKNKESSYLSDHSVRNTMFFMLGIGIWLFTFYFLLEKNIMDGSKNAIIGIATGIITSVLVTYFNEKANKKKETVLKERYRDIIISTLVTDITWIYRDITIPINRLLFSRKMDYLLLPENNKQIIKSLEYLESIEYTDLSNNEQRIITESKISYKMGFDLLDKMVNFPSQQFVEAGYFNEELYRLFQNYTLINSIKSEMKKMNNNATDYDKFNSLIKITRPFLFLISMLMRNFPIINNAIIKENQRIKAWLKEYEIDDYFHSDEYIEQEIRKYEDPDYLDYLAEQNDHEIEQRKEDFLTHLVYYIQKQDINGLIKYLDNNFDEIGYYQEIDIFLCAKENKHIMKSIELRILYTKIFDKDYHCSTKKNNQVQELLDTKIEWDEDIWGAF